MSATILNRLTKLDCTVQYYRLCLIDDFLQTFTKCKGLLGDYDPSNFGARNEGKHFWGGKIILKFDCRLGFPVLDLV